MAKDIVDIEKLTEELAGMPIVVLDVDNKEICPECGASTDEPCVKHKDDIENCWVHRQLEKNDRLPIETLHI